MDCIVTAEPTSPGGSYPTRAAAEVSDESLVGLWRQLVECDPLSPAVRDGNRTVNRSELGTWADAIAIALRRNGIRPGDVVLVHTDHGATTVAACLGVLTVGGCYSVADPFWPVARTRQVAQLAGARACIVGTVQPTDLDLPLIDVMADLDEAFDVPVPAMGGSDLAYILFTSGSTGVPKGVVQTHEGVHICARNQREQLGLGPDDRLLLLTAFSYDMAAVDMWSALLSGATLITYDLSSQGLADLPLTIVNAGVTVYHSTPTVLRALAGLADERSPCEVRTVLLGGEPVSARDIRAATETFGTAIDLVCGYGSTEASFSAFSRPDLGHGLPSVVPIGKPLPGFALELAEVTNEGIGELVVTGRGVARGYLGAPELTAERFVSNPDGTRSFRTGDLATRNAAGALVAVGRADRQFKIRGHRLEPAEVECVLAGVDNVADAAVVAEQRAGQDPVLVAYLQAKPGRDVDLKDVAARVAASLPAPARPSRYVVRAELSRTPTGKLDRAAIAGDESGRQVTSRSDNDWEIRIRQVVAGVLGLQSVGDQTFVELGATSLQLAQIHAALAGQTNLALVDLIQFPTVRRLAKRILDGPQGTTRKRGSA